MQTGDKPQPVRGTTLLAGLEAGMAAVLVMLAWLAFASIWYRHSAWTTINLMGSVFYGESALEPRLGRASLTGLAAYLLLYSILGSLFALVVEGRMPRLRKSLLGVVWGLAWYYLLFGLIWKQVAPLVLLYTHDSPMMVGHLLYGVLLGRYPRYIGLLGSPEVQEAEPVKEPESLESPRE
jgi:hypothetical protein